MNVVEKECGCDSRISSKGIKGTGAHSNLFLL